MVMVSKKGFTLIELLAVIVILALLVLIALPNVTSLMNSATENSFITEATEFANAASTAYAMSEITGKKSWFKKDTKSSEDYIYFCITIKELVNQGIVKKTNIDDYEGNIQLYIPKGSMDDKVTYTNVNITNKTTTLKNQSLIRLAKKTYESSKYSSSVDGSYSWECPDNFKEDNLKAAAKEE